MQAALQPVSSSDKLELVDQLTDYVSDALAEVKCGMPSPHCNSSMLFSVFRWFPCRGLLPMMSCSIFSRQGTTVKSIPPLPHTSSRTRMIDSGCALQLTSQLSDQAKFVSPPGRNLSLASQSKEETAGKSLSMSVDELSAAKQSRATADLLDWADDVANISGSLQGAGSSSEDELDGVHSDYPVITEAQASTAHRTPKQAMTSREAAAKALMKAARHGGSSRSSKDTPSRYMDSKFDTVPQCIISSLSYCFALTSSSRSQCMAIIAPTLHCRSCHVLSSSTVATLEL